GPAHGTPTPALAGSCLGITAPVSFAWLWATAPRDATACVPARRTTSRTTKAHAATTPRHPPDCGSPTASGVGSTFRMPSLQLVAPQQISRGSLRDRRL